MSDHTTNESTIKLCECGCGQPTPIAKCHDKRHGQIKGQPVRFISGHNGRKVRPPTEPRFCECGCGQLTSIAKRTNSKLGHTKGQHVRYIDGHQGRANRKATCAPPPRMRPEKKGKDPRRSVAVRSLPIEDRFWAKVAKGTANECWLWTASTYTNGYGQFWTGTNLTSAHRYAYFLANGEIPSDLIIRHKCDQVRCCNPAHLETGTQLDNVRDMHDRKRNRQAKGEKQANAKLTTEQVLFIRESFAAKKYSRKELAELLSISRATIQSVLLRKTWKHI